MVVVKVVIKHKIFVLIVIKGNIPVKLQNRHNFEYHNDPQCGDRRALGNTVDPDQTAS